MNSDLLTAPKPSRMSQEEARLSGQILWRLRRLVKNLNAGFLDPTDPNIVEIKAVAADWLRGQPFHAK